MKYGISKPSSPKMKRLGKGTECIIILLKQVSKDIYKPMIPMFSLSIAHTFAIQNFNIPTAVGR